jgi:hypothetical protein
MIDTTRIKNSLFRWEKLTWGKAVKYVSSIIGAIILICLVILILFPNPFINSFVKDQITKAYEEAYPGSSLQLGNMHYSVWTNRLKCDSIKLNTGNSALACKVDSFSISGIRWIKILLQGDFSTGILTGSVIDAQKTVLNLRKAQDVLHIGKIRLSIPDSTMTADSIKYFSLIDDEQFFAKSKFRQTRFRFNVPKIKIFGLDCLSLLQGKTYNAKNISMHNVFADILVNMDKPYDMNSTNPQMPNEALFAMKEKIKIDSLNIINGRLKYSERFAVRKKPGVITFDKVKVSVSGIANHTTYPDTAVIHGEGLFMNSGIMKLSIVIPITSKDFSLRYSGSLGTMDVTKLNAFIEAGEHHRIKSGVIQSARFNINVRSGHANGTLRVIYKDLTIAILNKDTGSEKGIFNRILSFFGKVFVIRGSNIPDEKGLMKIGEIKYTRNPQDYFLQFMWFALRGGVADVVGFPRE